jgi:Tol biopolymer transport system component
LFSFLKGATILLKTTNRNSLPALTPEDLYPEMYQNCLPRVFISTGLYERDIAISPDGKEIYFSIFLGDWVTIMVTRKINEVWTVPEAASFAWDTAVKRVEPAFSPDGKYFFFATDKRRKETFFANGEMNMTFFRERRNMPGNGNSDIYWVDATVIFKLNPKLSK